MSARPYSWFPLATADPVPGDPDAITRDAARYAEIAESIDTATSRLDNIASSSDMRADAVDAVRTKAEEIAKEVGKAHDRYETVASALSTYAQELRTAQAEADALLARAQTAQHAIDSATTEHTLAASAWTYLDEDATDDERRRAWNRLTAARTEVNDTEITLQHLRDELDLVIHHRDEAAQRAIDSIGAAIDGSELNDGWWDNWGSDVASMVSSVAGTISTIAGVASLFLGWVPILGQALALTAVIAGGVALLADIALAFNHEQDWFTVAIGIASIASFGYGRMVSRGVVAVSQSTTTAVSTTARLTARSGNPAIRALRSAVAQIGRSRLPSGELTVPRLFSGGLRLAPSTYATAFRAAKSQVLGSHNPLLALAGRAELINNGFVLQELEQVVLHPKALPVVAGAFQNALLQTKRATRLYLVDSGLNSYSSSQLLSGWLTPEEVSASERLHL
ncbi:MAG: hypothetical protein HGA51_11705 [Demequinaceae bacterium]|nr:hypothetical protein [Demequinaceae bacterium]